MTDVLIRMVDGGCADDQDETQIDATLNAKIALETARAAMTTELALRPEVATAEPGPCF
ncbi:MULTISPECIES: hypothetical protein [Bradyrhizobium]|uniref:hypothetical protein n=1 Tax=Bradyrhizobium TaxID=374 RepID=UPI0015CF26D8|nr:MULTISPECIES: hypothetical protein [Bradyrhizobium]